MKKLPGETEQCGQFLLMRPWETYDEVYQRLSGNLGMLCSGHLRNGGMAWGILLELTTMSEVDHVGKGSYRYVEKRIAVLTRKSPAGKQFIPIQDIAEKKARLEVCRARWPERGEA